MNNHKWTILTLNIILFAVMCIFMYNGYKSLSGFIANNFCDGLRMLVMVTAYFTPPLCFLFFIYNYYVKWANNVGRLIYSFTTLALTLFNIIFIFINIGVYTANASIGVYESLLTVFFPFPIDTILVNCALLILQIANIVNIFKPNKKISEFNDVFKMHGYLSFKIYEYILICVLAILTMIFIGDFFISFKAIENVLYDPKYFYLMAWVLLVPMTSFIFFFFKIEKRLSSNKHTIIYLSIIGGLQIVLTSLLFVFEAIYPNFIVRCGKPLFVITYSVSIPIEMIILLTISAITIILVPIKYFLCKKNKEIKPIGDTINS